MNGLPAPRRYWAIAAISLGTTLASVGANIATVALPTLAHDLGISPASSVLVVTVYQLLLVMTLLPLSALGGRVGPLRLYQFGQWLFLFASIFCFFAPSLPWLLFGRGVQALGSAASMSVSTALMRAIYPGDKLGMGIGISSVVVATSNALAPSIGGFVLSLADWPYVFLVGAPVALLSLVLGRFSLPTIEPHADRFDMAGALLCALGFGLLIGGLEGTLQGGLPLLAVPVLLAGVAVAAVFVRRELRAADPILPVDLLRQPVIGLSVLGALLAFIGAMSLLLSLPFRLQHQYGYAPRQVGTILMAWPLMVAVVAPFSGALSDRIRPGILGSFGMLCASIGMVLLAFVPAGAQPIDFIWRLALCGAGFGCYFSPNARLIIATIPRHRVASAGGLMSTNRLLGQTLGATLLAALLAFDLGNGRAPAMVGAALVFVAALCSGARLRVS